MGPRIRAAMAAAVAAVAVAACSTTTAATQRHETSGSSEPRRDDSRTAPTIGGVAPARRMSLSHICPHATYDGGTPTFTVPQLNAWMAQVHLPQWLAADVGITTPLRDGRVLWLFGDTLRPGGDRPSIVANSMWITDDLCVAQVSPPGGSEVIPTGRPKVVVWPNSAITVPSAGGDDVWVGATRTRRTAAANLFDIQVLGSTMAQFHVPSGGVPQLIGTWDITPDGGDQGRIDWGVAMLRAGGVVYVFGSRSDGGASARSAYVARTSIGGLTDPTTWRYWSGSTWSRSAAQAAPVVPASVGVSQTFSVTVLDRRLVLVSKVGGDLADDIGVWTASKPQGPWTLRTRTRRPLQDGTGFLTYAPLAHPELHTPDGGLVVSMSRNSPRPPSLWTGPADGRPVFIEVPRP